MQENTLSLEQILEHVDQRVGEIVETKVGGFLWKIVGGLLVTLLGVAVAWGAIHARVNQTEKEINALQQSAAVFLTRENVEDLLGGRDQRLNNIEMSLQRIEKKLDDIK